MFKTLEAARKQATANPNRFNRAYMVFTDQNGQIRVEKDNPNATHQKQDLTPEQLYQGALECSQCEGTDFDEQPSEADEQERKEQANQTDEHEHRFKPLYVHFATYLQALRNCQETAPNGQIRNPEWADKHEDTLKMLSKRRNQDGDNR